VEADAYRFTEFKTAVEGLRFVLRVASWRDANRLDRDLEASACAVWRTNLARHLLAWWAISALSEKHHCRFGGEMIRGT
jgi:hypothetical protein